MELFVREHRTLHPTPDFVAAPPSSMLQRKRAVAVRFTQNHDPQRLFQICICKFQFLSAETFDLTEG